MNATIWVLEHAQDLVSLVIAVVLLGLSAVLLLGLPGGSGRHHPAAAGRAVRRAAFIGTWKRAS